MFSRLFFAAVGLGAGVAVGIWTLRKFERTSEQLRPDALVARAGQRAAGMGERLQAALELGRQAAAQRETELRAAYLDGRGDGDAIR